MFCREFALPGLITKEQTGIKMFSSCGNPTLTLYVSGLAGWDLRLAVGRRGCSIGVARPNDSSSYASSYSDSSSVTSGRNLVEEIGSFRMLLDTTEGTKCQTTSLQGLEMSEYFTQCSFFFHFALHLCPLLAWKRQSTAINFLLTVLTHLITEQRR